MSQVDYLHFFNNILWNLIQFFILYFLISVIYVQIFYKIFRLRLLNYTNFNVIIKKQDYFINEIFIYLKKFYNILINIIEFLKINKNSNQKVIKCFYE